MAEPMAEPMTVDVHYDYFENQENLEDLILEYRKTLDASSFGTLVQARLHDGTCSLEHAAHKIIDVWWEGKTLKAMIHCHWIPIWYADTEVPKPISIHRICPRVPGPRELPRVNCDASPGGALQRRPDFP